MNIIERLQGRVMDLARAKLPANELVVTKDEWYELVKELAMQDRPPTPPSPPIKAETHSVFSYRVEYDHSAPVYLEQVARHKARMESYRKQQDDFNEQVQRGEIKLAGALGRLTVKVNND